MAGFVDRWFRLDGEVALISGAGRGIGRAIALAYAEAGASLALCARTKSELDGVAAEVRNLGARAEVLPLDVTDQTQATAVVEQAIASLGRIDVLVNSAGIGGRKSAVDLTVEEWDRLMSVNVKGLFFLTQLVGRHMTSRASGRIINISSPAGMRGQEEVSLYAASKGAINALTLSLAVEWGKFHVTVNAIAPGSVPTRLSQPRFSNAAFMESYVRKIPLQRLVELEDVACAALYLASLAGRNLTGQIIVVDGGRTIG